MGTTITIYLWVMAVLQFFEVLRAKEPGVAVIVAIFMLFSGYAAVWCGRNIWGL